MTSTKTLSTVRGVVITATLAVLAVLIPSIAQAQTSMPSAEEVREALETLRRFERALSAEPGRVVPAIPEATAVGGALSSSTVGAAPSPQMVVAPGSFSLSLDGDLDLAGYVFKDDVSFIHTAGGAVYRNTAVGQDALSSVTPGVPSALYGLSNSAFGRAALFDNTEGSFNTATGDKALRLNTVGTRNTATGLMALFANTTGGRNTANGLVALSSNTSGNGNTASGYRSLEDNTFGNENTAVGFAALANNTTGIQNTAIGFGAGGSWTTGNLNIAVGTGTSGVAGESGVIRIGGSNQQTKTFIEGIRGAISGDAVYGFDQDLCVDQFDQLGPCSMVLSSARFKQDIRDLDEKTGQQLLALRPVTFRYRRDATLETPLRYGLIAEEVASTFPGLVTYDDERKPYAVRYELLTPLMLAEIQRQEGEIAALHQQMADLRRRLEVVGK